MSTITFDTSGAFHGVTPDLYIGGKGAPIVDLPVVITSPDMSLEILAFVFIVFSLIALTGGGDKKLPPLTPQPPVTPPVAVVPLPTSALGLITSFAALFWWRKNSARGSR